MPASAPSASLRTTGCSWKKSKRHSRGHFPGTSIPRSCFVGPALLCAVFSRRVQHPCVPGARNQSESMHPFHLKTFQVPVYKFSNCSVHMRPFSSRKFSQVIRKHDSQLHRSGTAAPFCAHNVPRTPALSLPTVGPLFRLNRNPCLAACRTNPVQVLHRKFAVQQSCSRFSARFLQRGQASLSVCRAKATAHSFCTPFQLKASDSFQSVKIGASGRCKSSLLVILAR